MRQEKERQTSKKAKLARGLSVVAFAATASACEQRTPTEQDTLIPTEPIATQPIEIPTLTLEPEPSVTPLSALPVRSYPETDSGFILGAGGLDSEGEMLSWFSVDRDEWIETPAGEAALETYETEALSFPGVFGVEERNGSLVAVDGRGLSLYRLNSESGEWKEVPTIKPSDIAEEDRAYLRNKGQGRKAVPWGLYYSPLPYGDLRVDPEDGVNRYLLSGVLMETPWLERDNVVVFMLGIPNPKGEFSLIKVERELVWYKDANPQSGELLYPYTIGPSTPQGGYSVWEGTVRLEPLGEAIDLYSKVVGRQIAMTILLGSSPERLREYISGSLTEETCYSDHCKAILENIGRKLDETFVTAEQIKAGDYRGYDGKEFVTWIEEAHVPYYPKD